MNSSAARARSTAVPALRKTMQQLARVIALKGHGSWRPRMAIGGVVFALRNRSSLQTDVVV
jgi:hypothetical protein